MIYQVYKNILSDKPVSFLIGHLSYLENEVCSDVNEAIIDDFRVMIKATLDTLSERKI